jgi:diguanylate cyclase (GGDEF)-like protein
MNFSHAIRTIPQPLLFLLYALGVFLLWFFDTMTGPDLSFLVFYFLPIAAATWFSKKTTGTVTAVFCAAAWFFADVISHASYSHPAVPYWNVTVKLLVFLTVVELLSRLKTSLEREKQLARKDDLTGVSNRRSFFESAQIEIDRTHRYKRPFTLAYFDVDNFKQINDALGHETGDRALRTISDTIEKNIRSTDILARIGGDEFVLLLSETGFDQSHAVIEKINGLLVERMAKKKLPATFSIGVVTFLRPPANVDELLKKADSLMYTAKRDGKNVIRHVVWKESASAR